MIKHLTSSNVVIYDITVTSSDSEELPRLPYIPRESVVLVTGDAPTWRYGAALAHLRKSPAAMVAFRDPENDLFRIVLSGNFEYPEGTIIKI